MPLLFICVFDFRQHVYPASFHHAFTTNTNKLDALLDLDRNRAYTEEGNPHEDECDGPSQ
mgnify:CR=1 FL=1